jgi:hypothetical protein
MNILSKQGNSTVQERKQIILHQKQKIEEPLEEDDSKIYVF